MKAKNIKLGQLIKTQYGLATIMKIWAPKSISCILVGQNPFKVGTIAH